MSWPFGSGPSVPSNNEQLIFERKLNELQRDDSIQMFNNLTERCFANCVNNFRTSKLDTKERECVHRCATKFFKHTQRVSKGFQEETQQMQAEATGDGSVSLTPPSGK